MSRRRSIHNASDQQLAQPHPSLLPLSKTSQSEEGAGQRRSEVVTSRGAADRGGTVDPQLQRLHLQDRHYPQDHQILRDGPGRGAAAVLQGDRPGRGDPVSSNQISPGSYHVDDVHR